MANEFANNLIRLRKQQGLTQEKLAEKLNISTAAISKWEKGKSTPDIDTIIVLADYFGISTDRLLLPCNLTEDRIDKISKEYFDIFADKGYEAAKKYKDSLLNNYPKDDNIKIALAMNIQRCELFSKDEEQKNFLENEQAELLHKVADNENSETKNLAKYCLAAFYIRSNEYDKAETCLEEIKKEIYGDTDELLCSVYMSKKEYSKVKDVNERLLLNALNTLNNALFTATNVALKTEDIAKAKDIYTMHKQIFKILDCETLFGYMISINGMAIAEKLKDKNLMLLSLEENINAFLSSQKGYNNKLFKIDAESKTESDNKYNKAILKSLIEDLENNKKYDFVREESQFKVQLSKLKNL
jgi:transcriptional regulator with XRE-family HTH domain